MCRSDLNTDLFVEATLLGLGLSRLKQRPATQFKSEWAKIKPGLANALAELHYS